MLFVHETDKLNHNKLSAVKRKFPSDTFLAVSTTVVADVWYLNNDNGDDIEDVCNSRSG